MPIVDGCETIRHLKADARGHHISIIACSGLDLRHDTRECSADAVLTKPCPADQLLLDVRALLRRGAATA
jgi:DNA-binding response OmpR family regulator